MHCQSRTLNEWLSAAFFWADCDMLAPGPRNIVCFDLPCGLSPEWMRSWRARSDRLANPERCQFSEIHLCYSPSLTFRTGSTGKRFGVRRSGRDFLICGGSLPWKTVLLVGLRLSVKIIIWTFRVTHPRDFRGRRVAVGCSEICIDLRQVLLIPFSFRRDASRPFAV